jgi:5S rRNA maturation endonuclease (ribonuclease M5)
MMPIDRVLESLEAHDCNPRKAPDGWTARCPSHDDRRASLAVTTGHEDCVLVHCHAGCEKSDVLAALGLNASDLFTEAKGNGHPEIEATYDYVDEEGQLLSQAVRYRPKAFKQRRPDGAGGWTWKLGDVRRVLFRLPQIIDAVARGEIVYVVEGERDVKTLEAIGKVATCNAMGAGKWRAEYAESLRGAKVAIIADADDPGRKHAREVAASIEGVAAAVKLCEPSEGKDITDHLNAGLRLRDVVPLPDEPPREIEAKRPDLRVVVSGGEMAPIQSPMQAADLLDRVRALVGRFVVLPGEDATVAVALFVLHTWALDAAHATPYLVIVSPEKQTGKSRLLEVLALVVREPWHTASTSEAALFRKIERDAPTLLLDEIDATFGSNTERTEPLRAALNAGNRRGVTATRCVGQGANIETRDFSVFCPKVLAGIDTGRLPETIRDRAIVLHMKRRHGGERLERLRARFAEQECEPLVSALREWAAVGVDTLRDADPDLPDALSDRAADAWEPLLAIADLAGGAWPRMARTAALALSGAGDADEMSRGAKVLAAARDLMGGREAIATAELLEAINADEDLPFGAWRDGKGLDPRSLARILKSYDVKPRVLRIGDETPRGYRAEDLRDAWLRYLPPPLSEAQQAQQAQHGDDPPHENPRKHGDVADVADVALVTGIEGGVADRPDPTQEKPHQQAEPGESLTERVMREYGMQS